MFLQIRLEGSWDSCTVKEMVCFLWLVYHPVAMTSNIARLEEQKLGVLRLAHQLGTPCIVEAICQQLESSDTASSLEELVPPLATTEQLKLINTWAALVLKLAQLLRRPAPACQGLRLQQVKDQLSPTTWAALVACLLPRCEFSYYSSAPSLEEVGGWLSGETHTNKRPRCDDSQEEPVPVAAA
mgnify:CR=1 FL=1